MHCFKLHRSYSVSFNLLNLGEFSGVESERTVSKFSDTYMKFCVVFTYSINWAREIMRFHVTIVQEMYKQA